MKITGTIATGVAFLLATTSFAHALKTATRTIRGSVPGIVKTEAAIGPHSAKSKINLTITLKQRNAAAMKKLDAQLGQPGFKPLTQAEWQAKFAPTTAQIDAVTAWAKSKGLKVTKIDNGSGDVQVAASTGKIEAAFGVSINDYKLTTGFAPGTYHANTNNPSVPKNLKISGVFGLDNFPAAQPLAK